MKCTIIGIEVNHINFVPDSSKWVTSVEQERLINDLLETGMSVSVSKYRPSRLTYLANRYDLRSIFFHKFASRISLVDYFHGNFQLFDYEYLLIKRFQKFNHDKLIIRVTNEFMRSLLIDMNFTNKIINVPLGFDDSKFFPLSNVVRSSIRDRYGIPDEVFVIGSCQKDGVGWNEGMSPKLSKNPSGFVAVINRLSSEIRDQLCVVLVGPARGFLKSELSKYGIQFRHFHDVPIDNMSDIYGLMDCYLSTSLDEGGPKGILEAVACGVPVCSYEVGQLNWFWSDTLGKRIPRFDSEQLAEDFEDLILSSKSISDSTRLGFHDQVRRLSYTNTAKIWHQEIRGIE